VFVSLLVRLPSGIKLTMSTNRLATVLSDASWEQTRNEARRLCVILESNDSTEEEKYQALLALADLSGVLVHQFADAA